MSSFVMPYSLLHIPELSSSILSFLNGICPSVFILQFWILCCQASLFSLIFIFTSYKCISRSCIMLRKLLRVVYTSELFLSLLFIQSRLRHVISCYLIAVHSLNYFYLPYVLLLPQVFKSISEFSFYL